MIKENVSLKELSYYKIGGPGRYYLEVKSKDDLIFGLREWRQMDLGKPTYILGGITNLLIDDTGYDGLIIRNQIDFVEDKFPQVTFGSGLPFLKAISYCLEKSYSGFEWAGGLPGSIGGAIRGNAGSFGGEIKDNLIRVESLNLDSLETIIRTKEECDFDYRTSIFKKDKPNECIIAGTFSLKNGSKESIKSSIENKIQYRKDNQPLEFPSAGSTFKNVPVALVSAEISKKYEEFIKNDPFPVLPVALLLSEAGLKGRTIGQAQISAKHPNFIVNLGGAKSSDVLALIDLAKKIIKNKFGIEIEPEIIYLKHR